MSSFKDLRIVDNFYQTSAFFPMPTILVGTVSEKGATNQSLSPKKFRQRRATSIPSNTRRSASTPK